MRLVQFATLLTLSTAAAGCVTHTAIGRDAPSAMAAPRSGADEPIISSQQQCEALGGTWKRVGPRQLEACDRPTSDGGKACRDSSECQSRCLAPEGADPTKPVVGTCDRSHLQPTHCVSTVSKGRITAAECGK